MSLFGTSGIRRLVDKELFALALLTGMALGKNPEACHHRRRYAHVRRRLEAGAYGRAFRGGRICL